MLFKSKVYGRAVFKLALQPGTTPAKDDSGE